ncbi:MAG: hypothetical protein L0Y73_07790, partial [Candidatus Aminicenantes bacterium]|nr:hypothetical protein [Candidatus Aminicenantes bacterium]
MKKAKNINELANNLIPEEFLKKADKEFYVPIYDDILLELRDNIINDRVEAQTFFVAGQSGTGKTTALNFLENDELRKQYYVKYINMRDFLDERDVDIIDFLLTFAFALVKDTPLEDEYYQELDKIRKKHLGELMEENEKEETRTAGTGIQTEASAGGGFLDFIKLKAGFFANYKRDILYRKKTREIFNLKAPQLRELIDELIDKYIEKITKGKKLLVIIDDLDKIKEIKHINSIFLDNRNYIFGLKCKKVISIPTYLTTVPAISIYMPNPIRQFMLRLNHNPIDNSCDKEEEKKTIDENKDSLKKVINIRITDGIELIDDDALETAVEFSGGIIRQLVHIVRLAAARGRRLKVGKISKNDVLYAINTLRDAVARTIISTEKINLLYRIIEEHKPVSDKAEEFLELLHANNV